MSTTGYIDEHGVYHRGENREIPDDISSTHKEWRHGYERKQFSREIVQPHTKDGKPNPEFIRSYPGYSKKYFTQQQIDKALRDEAGSSI